MWEMNDVVKIEYKCDVVYHIVFDDGKNGDIDFSEYIGNDPVFEPFRIEHFSEGRKLKGAPFPGRMVPTLLPKRYMKKWNAKDVPKKEGVLKCLLYRLGE